MSYEVKPSGSLFVSAGDTRTGQTPASVSDLPVGAYQVTISRPNWPNYVANVNVERNGTANVQSVFNGGGVTVTSTPSGADVLRNNVKVGTTPYTLNAIPPVRRRRRPGGRPRRRPDKLHTDKSYDHRFCRDDCRRRWIEDSRRLGRHGWEIEGTLT